MWKSIYRCFIIKDRYVCTKDPDLGEVYRIIREMSGLNNDSAALCDMLRRVIDSLDSFAGNRRVSEEDTYIGLRRTLTLSYDTVSLYGDESDAVPGLLYDSIYKLQRLEEYADQVMPLKHKHKGGYDPKGSLAELKVTAVHATRDMSVSNIYASEYFLGADILKEHASADLGMQDGGIVNVVSVSDTAVVLRWADEEYRVGQDKPVSTKEYKVDNQYLTYDSLSLVFEYRKVPNYRELFNQIVSVGYDDKDKSRETAKTKKEILHYIDTAIVNGNTGLYVAKALLSASDSWATCKIDRFETFRSILREGIEKGCLAPDNYYGWDWIEIATKYNDACDFMEEDIELFYDILDTAAGNGVVVALDIMNSIWEPEQIIEED